MNSCSFLKGWLVGGCNLASAAELLDELLDELLEELLLEVLLLEELSGEVV